MIDAQGNTWVRAGSTCTRQDGRGSMTIVPAMTDAYILSVINGMYVDSVQEQVTKAVQALLDGFAQSRGYDNILSACTYANSAVAQFHAEGMRAVNLRDACWAKCYEILGAVQAGQRAMPTLADVLAEMPELSWG